jgi:glutamate synthase domain-containing protein 3
MFDANCNLEMVDLESVTSEEDERELKRLIARHVALTGSRKGQAILDDWGGARLRFVKVFPTEYRLALGKMSREDAATDRGEVDHV